jgi:DNA-directed RNA polymerase subunit F
MADTIQTIETLAPAAQSQVAPETTAPASKPNNFDSDYAAKFARLTAKERQLRDLENEIKTIREENSRFKKLRENASLNPDDVLNEFGLSYEGLTKRMLEGGDNKYATLEQRLAKIEEREKELENRSRESEQTQAYNTGINFIKKFCEDNGDEYEFIRLHEAYDDVLDLSAKYYKETGRYLNFDEAAKLVEKHLEEQADKLASSKKLQAKYFPKAQTEIAEENKQVFNQQPQKTLSNVGTNSAPQEAVNDEKILMQRAIAAYRNASKK